MDLELSVGAVGAALIGALISLVSLIVTKEAKISEFRQAWIDALRLSLTTFLVNVNAVVDASSVDFSDEKERFKEMQPFFNKLNESYYSIALRINSSESLSKDLQKIMVDLAKIVQSPKIDSQSFEKLRVDFIRSSAALLKSEWKRVKVGEVVYRWTRYIATFAVVLLFIVGALMVWNLSQETKKTDKRSPATSAAAPSLPRQHPQPSEERHKIRNSVAKPSEAAAKKLPPQ